MIATAFAFLVQVPGRWLLSPGDIVQTPTRSSLGTPVRREIEDRYYATPLYERDALAQREAKRATGFVRTLWLGLSPRWRREPPVKGAPLGREPRNDDREMLRARLLADGHHLYYPTYKPLLDRLMALPGSKEDYRLLRLASRSCFMVGGNTAQGLPFAKAAEALRPNDPTTWWTMKDTYYRCIVYGVGNGQENWKAYYRYVDLCRNLALAAKTPAAKEDVRRLDSDRQWLRKTVQTLYRPDGALKIKPNP